MSVEVVAEVTVSGNQVSIPAAIRRRFDIENDDVIRWKIVDGVLTVEVLNQRLNVFEGFTPGKSNEPVDVVAEHDTFGLDT